MMIALLSVVYGGIAVAVAIWIVQSVRLGREFEQHARHSAPAPVALEGDVHCGQFLASYTGRRLVDVHAPQVILRMSRCRG